MRKVEERGKKERIKCGKYLLWDKEKRERKEVLGKRKDERKEEKENEQNKFNMANVCSLQCYILLASSLGRLVVPWWINN